MDDQDTYIPEYRIEESIAGFEAQMKYLVGGAERWYALLETGYLADPNIWAVGSTGDSYVRVVLPNRAMAERAVLRARTINQQNTLQAIG